jgi:SAM-dependent methyltransferase
MSSTPPSSRDASQPAFWQSRWRDGQTGWDQGAPHPLLERLLGEAKGDRLLKPGARILEPGCGRAHNGATMARAGYVVTCFDVVPEAIDAARQLYADVPGLTLRVQDGTVVVPEWCASFDAVFDRAVLCALPKAKRRSYVEALFAHVVPGGVLMSLPFLEVRITEAEGPPFAIPLRELQELLMPYFSLAHVEEHPLAEAVGGKIAREGLTLWRRRERQLVEATAR